MFCLMIKLVAVAQTDVWVYLVCHRADSAWFSPGPVLLCPTLGRAMLGLSLLPGAASGLLLCADVLFLISSCFSCPGCVCAAAGLDSLLCCSSVESPVAQAGAESSHFTAGHRAAPIRDSALVPSHSHILTDVLLSSASPAPTLQVP